MICCLSKKKKELLIQGNFPQRNQQQYAQIDIPRIHEPEQQKSSLRTKQSIEPHKIVIDLNHSQTESYKTPVHSNSIQIPQFNSTKPLEIIIHDIKEASQEFRRQLEKEYLFAFLAASQQNEFIISYQWLNDYENYLSGNTETIGPIDNNTFQQNPLMELRYFKPIMFNKVLVNQQTWEFLKLLYGGGPQLTFNEADFQQEFPEESEASKPFVKNILKQKILKETMSIKLGSTFKRSSKKTNSSPIINLPEQAPQSNQSEISPHQKISIPIPIPIPIEVVQELTKQVEQDPQQNILQVGFPVLSKLGRLEIQVTGLRNPRFYCYVNSALQCLMSIAELNYFFLKEDIYSQKGSKRHNYAKEYQTFLQEVNQTGYYKSSVMSAYNIYNLSNDRFYYHEQQDSHEWLLHFLSELQEELCLKSKPKTWSEYCESHDSIIDKLFSGQIESKIWCKSCSQWSESWDPLMDLALPLETHFYSKDCKLQDCLSAYFREEIIGDKWNCEKCNKVGNNAKRQLKIRQSPNILIIQMKRFSLYPQNEKLHNNILYPEQLDMREFCTSNVQGSAYKLRGTIQHVGGLNGGHYTAVTRRGENWYRFNDDEVQQINNDYLKQKSAYILFYEKLM